MPQLAAVEALLDASDAVVGGLPLAELVSHQKLLQHTASDEPAAAFKELIALAARAHTSGRPAAAATAAAVSSSTAPEDAEALAAAMRTAYAVGAKGDWDGTGSFRHAQRRGAVKKPSRRESVSMSVFPGSSERPIEDTLLPVLRHVLPNLPGCCLPS